MPATDSTRFTRSVYSAGFTILELLIVIGIIAVLSSLLLTMVGRIRDKANAVSCASNEQQLCQAALEYATDNDNYLPAPSYLWDTPSAGGPQCAFACDQTSVLDFSVGTLWRYMPPSVSTRRHVLMCPSDSGLYARVGGGIIATDRNFSYSFNVNIRVDPSNTGSFATMKLQQIFQPTIRVMVFEEFGPNDFANCGPGDSDDWLGGRHGGVNSDSLTANTNTSQYQAYFNIGKANVCYFDGHVEMMNVSYYRTHTAFWSPLNQ